MFKLSLYVIFFLWFSYQKGRKGAENHVGSEHNVKKVVNTTSAFSIPYKKNKPSFKTPIKKTPEETSSFKTPVKQNASPVSTHAIEEDIPKCVHDEDEDFDENQCDEDAYADKQILHNVKADAEVVHNRMKAKVAQAQVIKRKREEKNTKPVKGRRLLEKMQRREKKSIRQFCFPDIPSSFSKQHVCISYV